MRALASRVFGWYSAPMRKMMTLTQQQRRTDIVAMGRVCCEDQG